LELEEDFSYPKISDSKQLMVSNYNTVCWRSHMQMGIYGIK
jgi:hypothetical protein